MNKIFVVGNLTRDPETRTTPSGVNVCSFTVACNRRQANQQGVREADFFQVTAWRQLGDTCARYLSKGRKVAVTGTLQIRTYDAQDGSKRTSIDITADEVEFLSSQNDASYAPRTENFVPQQAPAQAAPFQSGEGLSQTDDDELPF